MRGKDRRIPMLPDM